MLLEVGELSEGLITVGAVVGLDAQVDAQVLGQVGGVGKGFGAVRALVGLGLCVRLGVDLHLRLGEKGQRAYLTPVGKRQVHTGKIPAPTPCLDISGETFYVRETLHQGQSSPGRVQGARAGPQPGHPPIWRPKLFPLETDLQQAGEQAYISQGRGAGDSWFWGRGSSTPGERFSTLGVL